MLCIVDGGLDILNKSVLARGVWGVQQGSRSLLFYLSLIWGGICHLPPLNPILKVKSLPPSSIFPDSPCRSDNSSPLKQGRDGGRGKGGGGLSRLSSSIPQIAAFTPKSTPMIRGRAGQFLVLCRVIIPPHYLPLRQVWFCWPRPSGCSCREYSFVG